MITLPGLYVLHTLSSQHKVRNQHLKFKRSFRWKLEMYRVEFDISGFFKHVFSSGSCLTSLHSVAWQQPTIQAETQEQAALQPLLWSPQSPYFNIIETNWEYTKRNRKQRQLNSTDLQCIEEDWSSFNNSCSKTNLEEALRWKWPYCILPARKYSKSWCTRKWTNVLYEL